MQSYLLARLPLAEAGTQQVGKQGVIAIPMPFVVEWQQEEVGSL